MQPAAVRMIRREVANGHGLIISGIRTFDTYAVLHLSDD